MVNEEIKKKIFDNQHKINNDEGDSCLSASADRKQEEVKTSKDRFNDTSCFSTPDENCEICKDFSKEYWCGNPKNKVSTPNEEIIEKLKKKYTGEVSSTKLESWKEALSIKEQENRSWIQQTFKDDELINNWIEQKVNEKLSSLQEKIEPFLKYLIEEMRRNPDTLTYLRIDMERKLEEISEIFQEMGE